MEFDDRVIHLPERPDAAATEAEYGEWRRLAPLSIVSEIVSFFARSFIGLIAFGFFIMRNDDLGRFGMLFPFALLFFAIVPVLQWYRFRYRIDPREIRIAQGLLSRSLRIIPMERVVDVAIERKPVHRLLGLAKVTIETGGGGEAEEGALDALTLTEAENLRDIIRAAQLAGRAAPHAQANDIGPEHAEETLLFAMRPADLLIAGLFNFSLAFIAVVGAALNQFDFLIPFDIYDGDFWIKMLGESQFVLNMGWLTQGMAAAAAAASLLLLGAATGVIRTTLRDFGFTLTRTERGLRRRRGLLTQSDVVMPVHRIQSAIIATGPIRRWFGFYSLSVESLAKDAEKQDNHSLAPHIRLNAAQALLEEIDLSLEPGEPKYGRAMPVLLGGAIWAVVLIAIGAIMIWVGVHKTDVARDVPWLGNALQIAPYVIMAFGGWSTLGSWLDWRAHHYWLTDEHIYVRHGWWSQRLVILPLVKLQSIDWTQGPLTQAMGVAKIRFGVAGGSALAVHQLPWLPLAEVETLRAALIAPAAAVDYSVLVKRELRAAMSV